MTVAAMNSGDAVSTMPTGSASSIADIGNWKMVLSLPAGMGAWHAGIRLSEFVFAYTLVRLFDGRTTVSRAVGCNRNILGE